MFFEMAAGRLPDMKSSDKFAPLASNDPSTLELLKFTLKLEPEERPTATEIVRRIKEYEAEVALCA